MNITVIGCGRWGSFLTWYLDRMGHQTTLYGRPDSPHMAQFLSARSNGVVTLPPRVRLSTSLEAAVKEARILVISIGSQNLRGLHGPAGAPAETPFGRGPVHEGPGDGDRPAPFPDRRPIPARRYPRIRMAGAGPCAGIPGGHPQLHGDRFPGRGRQGPADPGLPGGPDPLLLRPGPLGQRGGRRRQKRDRHCRRACWTAWTAPT